MQESANECSNAFGRRQNEAEVGQAIKESGVAREDIWLTSKVSENQYFVRRREVQYMYFLAVELVPRSRGCRAYT